MSKGKRYDDEQKLNIKKVLIAALAVLLVIFFVKGINSLLKKENPTANAFTDISYFSMNNNGKWGVINSKGESIVEAKEDEMIVVPNNKKDVFVCTYDVNYDDGTYKTKAINAKNEEIFTSYENIEVVSNYDNNNDIWYESNCLKVKKDGKYGLIDLNGSEILSCVYDEITPIKGVENSLIIKKEESYGLVNASGNIIIEPEYKQISALTNDYKNGYVVKNNDGLFGIIGIDKNKILDCKYSDIKHVCGGGLYIAHNGDNWVVLKNSEDAGTELKQKDIKSINNENMVFVSDGKYGIISNEQEEKIAAEYQYIEHVFLDNYIAKKDDKFGVIKSSNETAVEFEYDTLSYDKDADILVGTKNGDESKYLIDRTLASKVTCKNYTVRNGYIRAFTGDDYKIYNLKLEEKSNRDAYANNTLYVAKNDGKYGLVNKDGKLVVSYQYEDITEQNEYGYVAVKKDGKWGIIDQYGNIASEPKYEFTDSKKVNVIGKWHLAENVNTIYYVCE